MTDPLPGFPIEVAFGPNGGLRRFQTPEEIEQFVTTEEQSWQWFPPAHSGTFETGYRSMFQQVRALLSRYRGSHNPIADANALKDFLRDQFTRSTYLHSSRPEAKFLADLQASDKKGAAAAWAILAGAELPVIQSEIPGLVRGILFKMGLPDRAEAERLALSNLFRESLQQAEDLHRKNSNFHNAGQAMLAEYETRAAELIEKMTNERDAQLLGLESEKAEAKEKLGAFLSDGKKSIETLIETYDKHMALRSAVEYWTRRQRSHVWRAIGFGALTLLAAVLGFEQIVKVAGDLLGSPKPYYWQIGAVLLLVTLVLWVIRILARVLMSNLHLELDAGERRVMALTYLALLREGAWPEDKEAKAKTLVLGSLFRHSTAGLIRDDAGPNTPLDMVSRLLSGK